MSDYAHDDRRSRLVVHDWTLGTRAMFGVCYLLFLLRAVLHRVMPWRRPQAFRTVARHESIFSEASTAASVLLASSFMGL